MKRIKFSLLAALAIVATATLSSCNVNDNEYNDGALNPDALVTIKPVDANSF